MGALICDQTLFSSPCVLRVLRAFVGAVQQLTPALDLTTWASERESCIVRRAPHPTLPPPLRKCRARGGKRGGRWDYLNRSRLGQGSFHGRSATETLLFV